MAAVLAGNGRPNRLLWIFFGISATVHVFVILYGSGLYRPTITIPIELTVRPSEPPKRKIPKTPVPSQMPVTPKELRPLAVPPASVSPPIPVKADFIRPSLPQRSTEEIVPPKPEALAIPDLKVSKRMPERVQSVQEKAPKSPAVPSREPDPAVREHYLSTIRQLIEQKKKYPQTARRRQFQGKVVVEFVLSPSGDVNSIRVVEGCRFGILNRAAIQAVELASPFPKPPDGLFEGHLPLRIPIVFELI